MSLINKIFALSFTINLKLDKNIYKYINFKRLASFSDKDFIRNQIFFLGILTVVFIAVDFNTEYAKEKNEIEFFAAILTDVSVDPTIDLNSIFIYTPPLICFLNYTIETYPDSISVNSNHVRGPPILST